MTSSEEITCIYTTYDSIEADMIKAQLANENIPCFLKTDNAGGMLPQLMTGISVMVLPEDKNKAAEVIRERQERSHLDD